MSGTYILKVCECVYDLLTNHHCEIIIDIEKNQMTNHHCEMQNPVVLHHSETSCRKSRTCSQLTIFISEDLMKCTITQRVTG